MFFELAIGIKSIVIIIALICAGLGLFPELPKSPKHAAAVIVAAPVIDNPWAAFVAAPDAAARLNIETAVKEMETTTRQADDNAARVALYSAHTQANSARVKQSLYMVGFAVFGMVGICLPLPKREEKS